MTTTTEIRGFFQEAKLVAEQELKITEAYAGLSKRASAVGIDWSQLKALAKASARDDEDNGGRVKKLTKKAEFAHSYAVVLKLEPDEDEQKRENHSSNAGHQKLADAKVALNNSLQSTATPSEIKEPAPDAPPCIAAVEPAKSLTVPAAASAGSLNSDDPLKQSENKRADKEERAAIPDPTKRQAAQGSPGNDEASAPTTSVDSKPIPDFLLRNPDNSVREEVRP